jgi:hypothetical protein
MDSTTEALMQDALERSFSKSQFKVEREKKLSDKDRVDFFLNLTSGGVAVECKVKGAPHSILLQLARYARHEAVSAVILITSKSMRMPQEVEGKPLYMVVSSRAWL